MLRTLAISSSLVSVLWLLAMRFIILDAYYASRPVAQIATTAMIVLQLAVTMMVFLGFKVLLRLSALFGGLLSAATLAWSLLDTGLGWANLLLLALQVSTLFLVVALYRKVSRVEGPSVLDLPIFG